MPYGWLTPLTEFLNTKAGRGQWGFSGSFAMYCWAWIKNGESREPKDIDLLIAPARFDQVGMDLYER